MAMKRKESEKCAEVVAVIKRFPDGFHLRIRIRRACALCANVIAARDRPIRTAKAKKLLALDSPDCLSLSRS